MDTVSAKEACFNAETKDSEKSVCLTRDMSLIEPHRNVAAGTGIRAMGAKESVCLPKEV